MAVNNQQNVPEDEWAAAIGVLAAQQDDPLVWSFLRRRLKDGSAYSIAHYPFKLPFLKEVYQAFKTMKPRDRIVIQKAAQMGFTEMAINIVFWFMNMKKENVLYVLPSQTQESDFAQERLDTGAIMPSPYIRKAFSETANVRLKIGWNQALYLRGAQSSIGLLSIPVGLLVRDEYDRMDAEGRDLAEHRLGASLWKWKFDLSNPSYFEIGINLLYEEGTKHEWCLKCENGHYEPPTWPDSIKDNKLVCPECGADVSKEEGLWIPKKPKAPYRSYHVSQLASPLVDPEDAQSQWEKAEGNLSRIQAFYNFVLGLPYKTQAIDLSPDMIKKSIGFHGQKTTGKHCFMGVDPGAVNWYVVLDSDRRIVAMGDASWEELERLMDDYGVECCGIEIEPETRAAKGFAFKFRSRTILVDYRPASSDPETQYKTIEDDKLQMVKPNRTEILDEALSPIRKGEPKIIPWDAPKSFFKHLGNIQRIRQIMSGREVYAYTNKGDDHFCHALAFATLAWQHRAKKRTGPTPMPSRIPKPSVWRGDERTRLSRLT